MADPFEVRMRFTTQLQHLSASVTSAQKAAHYALKYRDMDEDLHSCILEQLERNNMNNRANIMYFIEHLCDLATKENHLPFIHMIQRDILRVVDAAAPSDGSGAANVKHVRRVLNGLHGKSILSAETVAEIDACLKERERYSEDLLDFKAPDGGGSTDGAGDAQQRQSQQHQQQQDHPDEVKSGDILRSAASSKIKVDKRQIEQRIEEDRERNKRLREIIWAVPSNDPGELDTVWDDLSDIGDDDYLQTSEEGQERRRAAEAAVTLG